MAKDYRSKKCILAKVMYNLNVHFMIVDVARYFFQRIGLSLIKRYYLRE
jgi:hypothetical protein